MASSESSKYWDVNKTLSHNCLFNFIISARGGGKTYGTLSRVVKNYLNGQRNGERNEFVYVRRTEEEMRKLCITRGGRLFNAIARDFPEHTLKAEAMTMTCDKEVFGYAIPLSTAYKSKSDAFPYVDTIIFDEFIAAKRSMYLPDEVTKFLELYETVARPGTDHPPVKVFFLGNAITQTNPYFEYFRLERPYQGEFKKFGRTKDILVQDVSVPILQEDKHKSRFGQLIEGSEYANYAIDNEWLEDRTDFIKRKNKDCEYRMAIKYNGTWIGVWFDNIEWIYYISMDVNLQDPNKFSATTDDHQPNLMLIKNAKRMNSFKHLIDAYNVGAIRYESIKLQGWFRDVMRLLCRG
ncbi:phage DNA encapsidation protein [Methanomethylophilus alvi]|uniref:phage DNA encapsidation protein n=1 Tax=Methanomethylophilus alvi TaxID=1291540 RepID=UPI0037DD63BF